MVKRSLSIFSQDRPALVIAPSTTNFQIASRISLADKSGALD